MLTKTKLYLCKNLRAHGMDDTAPPMIYRCCHSQAILRFQCLLGFH